MTLIKSISGIRGTIGGIPGENLSPQDVVKFASAYAQFIKSKHSDKAIKIIVGRDARISGKLVNNLVVSSLNAMGIDVVDLGLSTTPTVEMAVVMENAEGGIIITASHNPKQWNALKLLNERGEFLSGEDGAEILKIAEEGNIEYATVDQLGKYSENTEYMDRHIEEILKIDLVDRNAIAKAGFKIAVDAVNSTGGIFVPALLRKLGVETIKELNCEPTGIFAHNPEPLPEHLTELSQLVVNEGCDLGITVDPDVDRLAFVSENGKMFGEEYTLVAISDYVLSQTPGNTVSNLSSTRALRDVTEKRGGVYSAAAVGEVNVVAKMKEVNAVIGGEGNGGVIFPELHYGRDALVGIALFLSQLAKSGKKVSELRAEFPNYFISKNKIDLDAKMDVDAILEQIAEQYKNENVSTIDGVKIDFEEGWVHLRKSNTEAIIRIYAESETESKANNLAAEIISRIKTLIS